MCSEAGRRVAAVLAAAVLAGCGAGPPPPPGEEVLALGWPQIAERARGQTVAVGMWTGDPSINRYITGWVAPRLAARHGVGLEVVSAEGREIVNLLLTELEAGKASSELDVVWINGENFDALRRIDALLGPFTQVLPGMRYVDADDPFIRYDFQQDTAGMEAPWGSVQLALITDRERVPDPPRTREELAVWVRDNPGRFTWGTGFTGMSFLKGLLIDLAGGPGSMDGPFDEEVYERAAGRLWAWVEEVRPYLWRRGESFPGSVAQLHQLFAAGEVDFTMSNNDGEVDAKVRQGIFPPTAEAFVLRTGTIRNTHYLGIPRRAAHVAGALVTIDLLLSPEAQYEKLDPGVWGDGTVLDPARLPEEWRRRFAEVPSRRHAPPRREMDPYALREPAPEVMRRLYDDFRSKVLGG